MNAIWTSIVIVALCILTALSPDKVSDVAINSANSALTTTFSMCGVYCLWLSIAEVMQKSGIVEMIARLTKPVNKALFGNLDDNVASDISMGLSANIIGAGNVATPFNLKAMSALTEKGALNRQGALLFVLNATGIQLIPSTVVGLRASALSSNPSDVILPSLVCTVVTSIIGVVAVMLLYDKCNT